MAQPKSNRRTWAFELPDELHGQLEKVAIRRRMSKGELVRWLIEREAATEEAIRPLEDDKPEAAGCISMGEAAAIFGLHPLTVRMWTRTGYIRGVRLHTGKLVVPTSEVERVIAEREEKPDGE